jgi:hypothetical protein
LEIPENDFLSFAERCRRIIKNKKIGMVIIRSGTNCRPMVIAENQATFERGNLFLIRGERPSRWST